MIISARIDATTAQNWPHSYPKHPRWPSSSSIIELADLTNVGQNALVQVRMVHAPQVAVHRGFVDSGRSEVLQIGNSPV